MSRSYKVVSSASPSRIFLKLIFTLVVMLFLMSPSAAANVLASLFSDADDPLHTATKEDPEEPEVNSNNNELVLHTTGRCLLSTAVSVPNLVVGPNAQINTHNTGSQHGVAMMVPATGAGIIGYTSDNFYDGSSQQDVVAQLLSVDSSGVISLQGSESRLSDLTTATDQNQLQFANTLLSGGELLYGYNDQERDGDGEGFFIESTNTSLVLVGSSMLGMGIAYKDQANGGLVANPLGSSVIVYTNTRAISDLTYDVVGRELDAQTNVLDLRFRINKNITGDQYSPRLTWTQTGNLIAVFLNDQDPSRVFYNGRNITGGALSESKDYCVDDNTTAIGIKSRPRIASFPNGDSVVLYAAAGVDGYQQIFFQMLYDGTQAPLLTNLQDIQLTPNGSNHTNAHIAISPEEDIFAVVCDSGAGKNISMAFFSKQGVALSSWESVNNVTTGTRSSASAEFVSRTQVLTAWQDTRNNDSDIFAAVVAKPTYAPTNISLSNHTLLEFANVGTPIGYVIVTDQDSTQFNFTIVDNNYTFAINSTTGLVVLLDPSNIDYEVAPQVNLRVRVTDLDNLSYEKDLTIQVINVNEGLALLNGTASVTEDIKPSATIDFLLGATDLDGDAINLTSVAGQTNSSEAVVGVHGRLTWLPNGNITYTVDDLDSSVNALNVNDSLTETFVVNATDSHGLYASAIYTVTIHGANDAPVTTSVSLVTAAEDTPVTFLLQGSDIDNAAVLSFVVTELPVNGTLIHANLSTPVVQGANMAATNGTLELRFEPDANYYGTAPNMSFKAFDGDKYSDAATINFNVTSVNDAPLFVNNATLSAVEDVQRVATSNVLSFVSDIEKDVLTLFSVNSSTNVNANVTGLYGALAWQTDGSVMYVIDPSNPTIQSFFGNTLLTDSFPITVKDAHGAATSAYLFVSITRSNIAPQVAVMTVVGLEDQLLPMQLNATDIDGNVSAIQIEAYPSNGTLYLDAAKTQLVITQTPYPSNGTLQVYYAPHDHFNGQDSFSIQATDDLGSLSTIQPVYVNVSAVNDPPVAAALIFHGYEDIAFLPVELSGSDLDGDIIQGFNITQLPNNGSLYIDSLLTTPVVPGVLYNASINGTLTCYFVPVANSYGLSTFKYRAYDGQVLSDVATISLNITSVNDWPILQPSAVIVQEDVMPVSALKNMLVGSLDIDGDGLQVFKVKAATPGQNATGIYGILVWDTAGTYRYYLNNHNQTIQALGTNQTLSELFSFYVDDGRGGVAQSNITVTIIGQNDAPMVNLSMVSATEDSPSVLLTLSATDVDSVVTSFRVTQLPSNGTLYWDANMTTPVTLNTVMAATNQQLALHFKPNKDFNHHAGIPAVGYQAFDGEDWSVVAEVKLNISAVNDFPTAQSAVTTVIEDLQPISTSVNLLAGSFDIDGDSLSVSQVNNLGPGQNVTGQYGYVAWNPAGGFKYYLNNSHSMVQALGTNDSLTDIFYFNISDSRGGVAQSNVTVTIIGQNDAPMVTLSMVSAIEDSPSILLTLSATDVDSVVTSFRVTQLPSNGTLYWDANMTTPVTLNTLMAATNQQLALHFKPNKDFNHYAGIPAVGYQAFDGEDWSVAVEIKLNISAVNDFPTAQSAVTTVIEDLQLISAPVNLLAGSFDIDGDSLSVSQVNHLGPGQNVTGQYGYVAWNPAGGLQYYLNNSHSMVQALGGNDSLTDIFYFNISDAHGGEVQSNLTVTIQGNNDQPTAHSVLLTAAEDTAFMSVILSGGDIDGVITQCRVTDLASNGTLYQDLNMTIPVVKNESMLTTAEQLTLYFKPDKDFNGVPVLKYQVFDDITWSAAATVSLNITAVNDPPLQSNINLAVEEDTQRTAITNVLLLASDPENDVLSLFAINGSSNANVNVTGLYGNLTWQTDGQVRYVIDPSNPTVQTFFGNTTLTDSFSITVKDSHGAATNAYLYVSVTRSNVQPKVAAITVVGLEDQLIPMQLNATDIDGVITAIQIEDYPNNGTLYLDAGKTQLLLKQIWYPSNGTLQVYYAPDDHFNGQDSFFIRAQDNQGKLSDAAAIVLNVSAVNDPPQASSLLLQGYEDIAYLPIELSASDIDGDPIAGFKVSNLPNNGTLYLDELFLQPMVPGVLYNATSNDTLTCFFVPTADTYGLPSFSYQAYDGQAYSLPETVTLNITEINDWPTLSPSVTLVQEDVMLTSVYKNMLVGSMDVDGDGLQVFQVKAATAGQNATGLYGTIVWDMAGGYRYYLNNSNHTVQALGTNQTLSDVFTFQVSDGRGGWAQSNITVTVHGYNDAPTVSMLMTTAPEDSQYVSITLSGADIDGMVTGFTIKTLPTNGTLYYGNSSMPVTVGALAAATNEQLQLRFVPKADFHGNATFEYCAHDNEICGNDALVTFKITPRVDQPQVTVTSLIGLEDRPIAVNITIQTATDGSEQVDSIEIDAVPAGANFSAGIQVSANKWRFTQQQLQNLTFTPPSDVSGIFNMTVNVTVRGIENDLISKQQSFVIMVNPSVDAPTLIVNNATVLEDQLIPLQIQALLNDLDGSETLKVNISGLPEGAVLTSGQKNSDGYTLVAADLNNLNITLPNNYNKNFTLTIKAIATESNGDFKIVTRYLQVDIAPIPDPISNFNLVQAGIAENSAKTTLIGVLSSTTTDGGNATYRLVAGVGDENNADLTIIGTRLYANKTFNFENQAMLSVRIEVDDQQGAVQVTVFTIPVLNLNEAPINLTLSANKIAENSLDNTIVGNISAFDPDVNETYQFSLLNNASNRFKISGDGVLRVANGSALDFEDQSSHAIVVRVTDSGGNVFDKIFLIELQNVVEAPVIKTAHLDDAPVLSRQHFDAGSPDLSPSEIGWMIFSLTGGEIREIKTQQARTFFTQDQVDKGELGFYEYEMGSEVNFHAIAVRIESQLYTASAEIVDNGIVAHNDKLIAGPISTFQVTADSFNATAPGVPAEQLWWQFSAVTGGRYWYADRGEEVGFFSQAEVNDNAIYFVPNITEARIPSYQFNVYIGTQQSFTVPVAADKPPVGEVSVVVLHKGGSVSLPPALTVFDESPPDVLIEVDPVATQHVRLVRVNNRHETVYSFLWSEAFSLVVLHDNSNNGGAMRLFLNDDLHRVPVSLSLDFFGAPSLQRAQLDLQHGTVTTLTTADFHATSSRIDKENIVYRDVVTNGLLKRDGVLMGNVSTALFSEADIEAGLITLEPLDGLPVSMSFVVAERGSDIESEVISADIITRSINNNVLPAIKSQPFDMLEGGEHWLTSSDISIFGDRDQVMLDGHFVIIDVGDFAFLRGNGSGILLSVGDSFALSELIGQGGIRVVHNGNPSFNSFTLQPLSTNNQRGTVSLGRMAFTLVNDFPVMHPLSPYFLSPGEYLKINARQQFTDEEDPPGLLRVTCGLLNQTRVIQRFESLGGRLEITAGVPGSVNISCYAVDSQQARSAILSVQIKVFDSSSDEANVVTWIVPVLLVLAIAAMTFFNRKIRKVMGLCCGENYFKEIIDKEEKSAFDGGFSNRALIIKAFNDMDDLGLATDEDDMRQFLVVVSAWLEKARKKSPRYAFKLSGMKPEDANRVIDAVIETVVQQLASGCGARCSRIFKPAISESFIRKNLNVLAATLVTRIKSLGLQPEQLGNAGRLFQWDDEDWERINREAQRRQALDFKSDSKVDEKHQYQMN